jgi:hypothetical protein
LKFHLRRTKRVAALATALSTVALVVQLTTPALAAVTFPDDVQSIFPAHDAGSTDFANDYSGSTQMAVLTNSPVGAHLTAVSADPSAEATNGATLMAWFYCTPGTFPPNAANCTPIGVDTTPTIAPAAAGYTNTSAGDGTIDAAWDLAWVIPATLTGEVVDIAAVGCNGAPTATLSNCTQDVVPDVLLDGGGGPLPQTSWGQIASPQNGSVFTQEVDTAVAGATSPEITAVAFGFDPGADSGDDGLGGAGNDDVDTVGPYEGTLVTTSATGTVWGANVPAGDISVGEYALTFFGTNEAGLASGIVSAPCGAPCTAVTGGLAFDRNYVVAEAGTPGEPDSVQVHLAADVVAGPRCQTGSKAIFAPAGSTVNLTGCVLDAFFNGVADEPVFWSIANTPNTNGAAFVGTPGLTTDANGQANADVTGPGTAAGTSTVVTFCDDPNANGSCLGGAGSDTFTISWISGATHARSVSLKLKDSLRAKGTVSVGDGFTACADTVRVKIQRRANGSWHTKKTTTTASDGTYHAKLKNKSGKYRAVAPATTAAGDTCLKATSPKRKYKA